jgi:hypothetical protein
MKKAILVFVFLLLCLPFASLQATTVQDLTWTQLQAQMSGNPKQNVLIEFYSSKADALDCDKCTQQSAVFSEVARRHSNDVAFVRIDVATVPFLIENGTVRIYPTHLFVRHNVPQGQEMVARTVLGFLNAKQFEELISEFFEVTP